MIWSVAVMLAVLAAAFLTMRQLARVQSYRFRWCVGLATWCAAIAAFLLVDVNIPLSESHLYPDNRPAPLWLALCALFARFAAFACLAMARVTSPESLAEPHPAGSQNAPTEKEPT